MKIRLGFITNSSSSSFIVVFPFIPKNPRDIEKLLFKNRTEIKPYDNSVSTKDAADYIFSAMIGQTPNDKKAILAEFSAYEFADIDSGDTTGIDGQFNDKDEYHQYMADKFLGILAKCHPDGYIYVFEFHDDSGAPIESALEHGEVFSEVPHVRFSHH